REPLAVAPERGGARRDLFARGKPPIGIVARLERTETCFADRRGRRGEIGAALAAHQAVGDEAGGGTLGRGGRRTRGGESRGGHRFLPPAATRGAAASGESKRPVRDDRRRGGHLPG